MTVPSELPLVSRPLPWHEREWTRLTAQERGGRLPHALLLTGREHIGKSQFALALSRLLLCSQSEGLFNCGHCHACELSSQGHHGDFRWICPIDSSRFIKIEQVREAVRFTNTTAGFGTRKVIVFAPADTMNMNAFNALLKSLEEPAKDTHLILICNQMQNVPLTIRSRCQLLRLATPNAIDCIEWLDKTTADPAQSASLLAIAGGLPLLAEQLFLNGAADEYLARGIALKQLSDGQVRIAEVVELWSDDTTGKFLDFLGENLQYIVSTLPAAQLKTAQVHTIFRLLDEVYVLQRAINAGANPNKSLLLMSILSKYRRLLGTCLLGDNIPTRTGDTSV